MDMKESLIKAVKSLESAIQAVENIHPMYGKDIREIKDGMVEQLRDEVMLENGLSGAEFESYQKAEIIVEELLSESNEISNTGNFISEVLGVVQRTENVKCLALPEYKVIEDKISEIAELLPIAEVE